MTDLRRVNEFHRDAFERANRQPQVAMSILAHQLVQALEERDEARQVYIEDECPSSEFLVARGWPIPEGYRR